jgi:VWFA-related protein
MALSRLQERGRAISFVEDSRKSCAVMSAVSKPKSWSGGGRVRHAPVLVMLIGLTFATVRAIGSARSAGQEPQKEPVPAIVARVDLVNVEVTVTNDRGDFVAGLKRENFRVLDNGIEQPITHFAPVEAPAQVLVLVETSPAVYLIHRQHLAGAHALLENLAVDDKVALGTYDQSARLAVSFSAEKQALAHALGGLRYSLGSAELNLFDALSTALDWIAAGQNKQAIVLLSTGLDTSGASSWQKLATKLRSSRVGVFPVALGGELRSARRVKGQPGEAEEAPGQDSVLSFVQADKNMEQIAELTGGQAYFPRDAREFTAIYQQLARLLRNQYSLGFAPPVKDGMVHRIQVQIVGDVAACASPRKDRGSKESGPVTNTCRVRSRQEYTAPAS